MPTGVQALLVSASSWHGGEDNLQRLLDIPV